MVSKTYLEEELGKLRTELVDLLEKKEDEHKAFVDKLNSELAMKNKEIQTLKDNLKRSDDRLTLIARKTVQCRPRSLV